MSVLRQSTAVTVCVGPFLHLTAGTSMEALTVTNAEVYLSKNGAGTGAKTDATSLAHLQGGMYSCVLDATDTNTVGRLHIIVDDAAADSIPVMAEYQIVEEAIYDAIYTSGADGFNASGQVSLLTATQASIDAIEVDTGTTLDAALAVVDANVDAILTDTGTTLDGKLDAIDNFIDTEIAAITAALVTASGEPAQGAPPVSASTADKISWLYKFMRNRQICSATSLEVYDDGGTVVDHKSVTSDDGSQFIRGEFITGP